ncbi:MAG: hypothetical protein WA821_15125 [Anaerolineales bacterium]
MFISAPLPAILPGFPALRCLKTSALSKLPWYHPHSAEKPYVEIYFDVQLAVDHRDFQRTNTGHGAIAAAKSVFAFQLGMTEERLGIAEVHVGMTEVRVGTTEVHVGTTEVHVGTTEVRVGITEVHVGMTEVRVGTTEVHVGITNVHVGMTEVRVGMTEVH